MSDYLSPTGTTLTVDTAVLRTSPSPSEGSAVSEGSTLAEEPQKTTEFSGSKEEDLDVQAYLRHWKSRSPRNAPTAGKKAQVNGKSDMKKQAPPKSPSPTPSNPSSGKSSTIKPTAGSKPAKDIKGV